GPAGGAGGRPPAQRLDQDHRRLHALARGLPLQGHLGSARAHLRRVRHRSLHVGHRLDPRGQAAHVPAGHRRLPQHRSPVRKRQAHADGRHAAARVQVVADEGVNGRRPMRTVIILLTSILMASPLTAHAQDNRAALEAVAKALGEPGLKSIEIQGGGTFFWAGQSYTPGQAYPQFTVRSFTRTVNYDTASLRDEMVRTRTLEPPKGGGPYVRGEHKAVGVLSGDQAWNVTGDAAASAPLALAERQFH